MTNSNDFSRSLRTLSSDIQRTFDELGLDQKEKKPSFFRRLFSSEAQAQNDYRSKIDYSYMKRSGISSPKPEKESLFHRLFSRTTNSSAPTYYTTIDERKRRKQKGVRTSSNMNHFSAEFKRAGRTRRRREMVAGLRNSISNFTGSARNGAMTQMNRFSGKKSHAALYSFFGLLLLAGLGILFGRSAVFSADESASELVCSYTGDMKLQSYFEKLENPDENGAAESIVENDSLAPTFYFYEVEEGDSIYSIAKEVGLTMDALISFNVMDNAHLISIGDRLLVPNRKGILYCVEDDDTLDGLAETYGIEKDSILRANDLDSDFVNVGQMVFLPDAKFTSEQRAEILGYYFYKPLHGRVSSVYGYRIHPITGKWKFHSGIDIAASWGTAIGAAKEGTVTFAGYNGGYGYCVKIKHQFGYTTLYAHMSSISVSVGDYVSAQQTIGYVGSTGVSTGAHLHFEVQRFGSTTNPATYEGLMYTGGYF